MIHQVENAIELAKLGFCAEVIRQACPAVPNKLIADHAIPKRQWQERKIPSLVFSAALDGKVLVKRELSVTAVIRYFEFASSHKSFAFCKIDEHHPKITLDLDPKIYRKVSPENAERKIEIDLFTVSRAYNTVLDGFLRAEPTAIPTINETLTLVKGVYTGDFFIIDCLCGRPVLVENKPSRGADGDFQRDFLTCPWCGKRSIRHCEHFERQMEKFSNWTGLS